MQLSNLENLLGIKIAAEQTEMYTERLEAAIDEAKAYTNNNFLDKDGIENIPAGAKMGIALLVKGMGEGQNVSSQSLGDMSKSFFEGGTAKAGYKKLKPYRKVGFR